MVICLLALAATAGAEEKVVPLARGMRVWRILEGEGCSAKQIDVLWPLVVKDSGLDPKDERRFPVGRLILVKRNCDGQLREGDKTLRAKVDSIKRELDEAKGTLENLRKETGEKI
jgi:hypothetical protein